MVTLTFSHKAGWKAGSRPEGRTPQRQTKGRLQEAGAAGLGCCRLGVLEKARKRYSRAINAT